MTKCDHARFAIDRDERHGKTSEYGAMCLICGKHLWIAPCEGCADPACETAHSEEPEGWTFQRVEATGND